MEFASYFDIIVISIVVILAFKGLFSGFIRELFSIIGIVGGVLLASRFNVGFGSWINSFLKIESQTLVNLIGFIVILGFIWILSIILAEIVVRFARFINLGRLDKILGFFIAGLKIFLVISIMLFTFSRINFLSNFTNKLQDSSFCYPVMTKIGGFIVKINVVSEVRSEMMNFGNEATKVLLENKDNQALKELLK